jgi:hypothetical protein
MKNGRIESFLACCGPILLFMLLMSTFGAAEQKKARVMTGSAAKGGAPANLKVAADLE